MDVRADVEDADLERRLGIGLAQKGSDVILLPCVERAGERSAASCFDSLDQWHQLLAIAAAGEYGETFSGEFAGDCSADEVARTDHRRGGVPAFHLVSPLLVSVSRWC